MYSLYIVDDEASIREGIAASIPWATLGFTVAGTFSNGQDALAAIRANTVDVVMTDIRMPMVDGVELMRTVSAEFPKIRIVVLSGYSDLEYLRTAIQNRVVEYLLKPTKKANIIALFERLRLELDADNQQDMELQYLKEQTNQAMALQKAERMRLYLRGAVDPQTVRQNEDIYGDTDLSLFYCRVMLATPDGRLGDDESALHRLKQAVVNTLRALPGHGGFLLSHEDIITGILPGSDEAVSAEALQTMQREVHKSTGATISIGLSDVCTEPGELNRYYEQARCSMMQSIFLGPQTIFHYHMFEQHADEVKSAIDLDALKNALVNQSRAEIDAVLDAYFEPFRNRAIKEYAYIDQHCLEVLLNLARWSAGFGIRFEQLLASLGAQYADIYKCDSLDRKKHYLGTILYTLQDILKQGAEPGSKSKSLAQYLKQVVDEEYTNYNLSLDYIADKLQRTPGHISKIFRTEIGMTFYDYVLHKRMEAACALLKDPAVKIYEVAGRVGYNSSSSFIRVFKSQYGMTPNDYRYTHMGAREAL